MSPLHPWQGVGGITSLRFYICEAGFETFGGAGDIVACQRLPAHVLGTTTAALDTRTRAAGRRRLDEAGDNIAGSARNVETPGGLRLPTLIGGHC